MKFPAKLIPVEGEIRDVEIARFEDLRSLIGGGFVELVRVAEGRLVFDGLGLLKQLPENLRASALYSGGYIAGDALLFTEEVFQAFDASLAL